MRSIPLVCIFLGAASLIHAQAQSAQATPPPLGPGPLLRRAPTLAQWLVSMKPGHIEPTELGNPQTKYEERTLVRKSGAVRNEITAYSDGRKTEIWLSNGVQALITPGQADPTFTVAGANARADGVLADYSKSDFVGFEWITKNNYTGVQMMAGIPCIVFHEGPVELAPANAPPVNPNIPPPIPQSGDTAYIAADSRLPVLLQTDEGATYYQWEAPPAGPLTLPAGVQNFINMIEARKRQAEAPPAAP